MRYQDSQVEGLWDGGKDKSDRQRNGPDIPIVHIESSKSMIWAFGDRKPKI